MNIKIIVAFLFLFPIYVKSDELLMKSTNRIINGNEVTNLIPWMVSIKIHDTHICGGTLINPYWVITAAHCLESLNSSNPELSLELGTVYLSEGNIINSDFFILHPLWNQFDTSNYYDIALVHLSEPASQSSLLMVDSSYNPEIGYESIALGWGVTNTNFITPSRMLNWVRLPIQSTIDCKLIYDGEYNIDENIQFCAGYIQGERDTCLGDSGGPLVVFYRGAWRLAGITSFGGHKNSTISCGEANAYGVYTKVSAFRQFIDEWILKKLYISGLVETKNNYHLVNYYLHEDFSVRVYVDLWVAIRFNNQLYFMSGTPNNPILGVEPVRFMIGIPPNDRSHTILNMYIPIELKGNIQIYAAYTEVGKPLDYDYFYSNIATSSFELK